MQQEFIDKLVERVRTDPAIYAVWLEGSFGRGEEDRYADVDAHLLISESHIAEFKTNCEAWLGEICPLVLYREMFDGYMANAMSTEGLRLDVVFHDGEKALLGGKSVKVLLDKGAYLDLETIDEKRGRARDNKSMVERHIPELWRMFSLGPTAIGRNELAIAMMGLGLEIMMLSDLLILQSGNQRESGIKRLNQYLLPEIQSELNRTLHMEGLTQEGLMRTHLGMAAILRRYGPEIAARHGIEYPIALEKAVIGYLEREVKVMGLDSCLAVLAKPDDD